MDENAEVDACDVFRIMVSTDNHLGYKEKDAIRGEDSFTAFEEMLVMAVEENVDFILLGGDLFHDAVPSQNSLNRCMKLLRRYVFGDKAIDFEVLSDQAVNFHGAINDTVNYEDPNLNISIPVFSIHGNHDDPSSFGCLSSLDLLSTTGLVNYIGRCGDLTKVEIKPVLLQKGITKLAIYGLSHIHDERLHRLFEKLNVEIDCPEGEKDDWFHLMVLHQNRAMRGHKNFLPEHILPDFLHLIIWGHEHDCRIEPEHNTQKDFYVSQPGSSVPTSLAEGEAIKKHVGILKIYQNKFQLQPLPLKTVRPFVFESLDLDELANEGDLDGADAAEKVRAVAEQRIEEMIERSKKLLTGHEKQPTLPLIRLRLIYSQEQHMFNALRFGQGFNERIANPDDVVHFKKSIKRFKKDGEGFDKEAFQKAFKNMELEANSRLEDLLERYFETAETSKKLQLMPTKLVSEITTQMVERRDTNAVDNMISNFEDKVLTHLMESLPSDEQFDEHFKQVQTSLTADEIGELLLQNKKASVKETNGRSTAKKRKVDTNDSDDEPATVDNNASDDDLEVTSIRTASAPTRGRGRGRGRGARGGSTTAAATRTKANASTSSSNTRSAASKHVMQPLDVSVTTRKSPRKTVQPSILNSLASSQRRTKAATYVISDDSD